MDNVEEKVIPMNRRFLLIPVLAALLGLGPLVMHAGELQAQIEYPEQRTRAGHVWDRDIPRYLSTLGMRQYEAHPATQDPARLVTAEDTRRWEEELSNWGRWGDDDTRGALNMITPQKALEAIALVEEGRTVNLMHMAEFHPSVDGWRFWPGEKWLTSVNPETGEVGTGAALDAIRFSTHDGTLSHLDAICHYDRRPPLADIDPDYRVTYNNHRHPRTELSCQGDVGVMGMGEGYVTRAVLVDMPLMKRVEWLEPSTPIFIEDLEAWEEFAGVTIGEGDALLIRTGRWAKREAEGPWKYDQGGAGLHASVLPWLRERDVSLLVGDAVTDVQPSGVEGFGRPVHTISMVAMGLPLVDNGYLEDVAATAREFQRWEFMLSWLINQSDGGTAVPFSGVATF